MTSKLTTKQAIEQVLTGKRNPMTVGEIAEAAIPLTALTGKTPKQTFYSVLYGEAKKTDGLVVKAGKGGVFKLNPKRKAATPKAEKAETKAATSKRATAKRGSTKRAASKPAAKRSPAKKNGPAKLAAVIAPVQPAEEASDAQ